MIWYPGGAEAPSHRNLLIEHDAPHVAMSYMGLRRRVKFAQPWLIADHFGDRDVLLDSGAATLNREGVEMDPTEIEEIAEHYDLFTSENADAIGGFVEMDAMLMGADWIRARRREHLAEQRIVVWHQEWGVEELKRMADQHGRIAVGQGACGDRTVVATLRAMARSGTRILGMGVSSQKLLTALDWDAVTSTTWLSATSHGETFVWAGNELHRYPARYKGQARRRHAALFTTVGLDAGLIADDDPTENLRLSLWSWQQAIDHMNQRGGRVVALFPNPGNPENAETDPDQAAAFDGDECREWATPPPAERVKKLIPGLAQEAFEHHYTDPEDGKKKTRTKYRVRSVDVTRMCEGCYIAAQCPEFKAGEECAFEIPIEATTKEQYISLIDYIIGNEAQEVAFGKMIKSAMGGYPDPNISSTTDRLARLIKLRLDLENAAFTVSMQVRATEGAQLGLISRLFGKDPAATPALENRTTVTAAEQLGVVDAEVVGEDLDR